MSSPETSPPPRERRVKSVVLVISLAVNLAVAGLAIGAWWHGPDGRGMRDLGFGPFDEAMRPQDRMALKAMMRDRTDALKQSRTEMAADAAAVVAALRADPFDAKALQTALDAQQDHMAERLRIGSTAVGDYLASLSPADREAFAGRLEERLSHPPPDQPKP